jgi:hypothetical protein
MALADVAADAIQPGPEAFRLAQALQVPPCLHKGFLDRILDACWLYSIPPGQSLQAWTRLLKQALKVRMQVAIKVCWRQLAD